MPPRPEIVGVDPAAFFEWAAEVDVRDVTRLATTIERWRGELMAYFCTGHAPTAPSKPSTVNSRRRPDRTRFRNFDNYRTRMLLKTAVALQAPATPRLRGPKSQTYPPPPRSSRSPSFIARFEGHLVAGKAYLWR
ncbi:MAG: hypothetical protein M3O70_06665 [Actinomycetota bacterium]|nr:hypothetical protein [Actinomycetota bacterium]